MALNFDDVRPHAKGQWLSILSHVAPTLGEAIERFPRHVACPVHGGKDGFRLYKDVDMSGGGICNTCGAFSDGFALISWANNCQLSDALRAVVNYLGIDEKNSQEIQPTVKRAAIISTPEKNPKTIERKREKLNSVKRELVALDKPQAKPVREYLTNRGLADCLSAEPKDIYFHPALHYWHDGEDYGNLPAMIAIVRDVQGRPVTLHRTYLSTDGGKANVPAVKKLMSPVIPGRSKGAAVQLYPAGKELILAEGIETALALHLALKKPSWACVSAGGLEAVELPSQVKEVIIGADNDSNGAGQMASAKLARRLKLEQHNRMIKIITPTQVGQDWLDVFNSEGIAA